MPSTQDMRPILSRKPAAGDANLPTAPLALDAALAQALEQTPSPAVLERSSLAEAQGRVAAEDLASKTDLPSFPASAMDGYAFRWRPGISALKVVGASLAGHPFVGRAQENTCVRITTGAPLPTPCDTVVIQEDCQRTGDEVRMRTAVKAGANVRQIGHDLRRGELVVERGQPLNPLRIGALAACGWDVLQVFARPRIALLSTGDELQPPGTILEYGKIYDSNRCALKGLLAGLPTEVEDLGVLADDAAAIEGALLRASRRCQLLLASGGVSVGDADLVRDAVQSLGELHFWRLNLKPGKPLAFGRIGKALFLGLPGNPVSAILTFLLIAKPTVQKLCGMRPAPPLRLNAELTVPIKHRPGREEFQRGMLKSQEGRTQVATTGDQSSNRISSFVAANCLIRIPPDAGDLTPGTQVEALPFEGLL